MKTVEDFLDKFYEVDREAAGDLEEKMLKSFDMVSPEFVDNENKTATICVDRFLNMVYVSDTLLNKSYLFYFSDRDDVKRIEFDEIVQCEVADDFMSKVRGIWNGTPYSFNVEVCLELSQFEKNFILTESAKYDLTPSEYLEWVLQRAIKDCKTFEKKV